MHSHCFSKGGLLAGRVSVMGAGGLGGRREDCSLRCIFRPTSHLDKWVNFFFFFYCAGS